MSPELVVGIIVAVFGGGGLAALLRLRGESAKIVVDASAGAVVLQSTVITDLRTEVTELRKEVEEVKATLEREIERRRTAEHDLASERRQREEAERQRDLFMRANEDLRAHVDLLENRFNQRFPDDDSPT